MRRPSFTPRFVIRRERRLTVDPPEDDAPPSLTLRLHTATVRQDYPAAPTEDASEPAAPSRREDTEP